MNYVKEYLRLEKLAGSAERTVEAQRQIAEEARFEQCRVAYRAVSDGGYTQARFAAEVGVNQKTIQRRAAIGAECLNRPLAFSSFGDAWAWSVGSTQAKETDRKQISNARAVMRDRESLRQLMEDPEIRAAVRHALIHSEPYTMSRVEHIEPEQSHAERTDARVISSATFLVGAQHEREEGTYKPGRDARLMLDTIFPSKIDWNAGLASLTHEGE